MSGRQKVVSSCKINIRSIIVCYVEEIVVKVVIYLFIYLFYGIRITLVIKVASFLLHKLTPLSQSIQASEL